MTQHHGKFVSYLRVSTKRQGRSGLGLEAQRKAVADFLNGGRWTLAAEFVEVESGKRDDRPQLAAALEACKLYGATLVIAKLDRLSRDAHFLLGLQKAGVKFVAADMPEANELTIGIMAVVAQAERKMISARTKAALAAAKARGVNARQPERRSGDAGEGRGAVGGSRRRCARPGPTNGRSGCRASSSNLRQQGIVSANATAQALNERGIPTARGGKWTARSVINVRARLA